MGRGLLTVIIIILLVALVVSLYYIFTRVGIPNIISTPSPSPNVTVFPTATPLPTVSPTGTGAVSQTTTEGVVGNITPTSRAGVSIIEIYPPNSTTGVKYEVSNQTRILNESGNTTNSSYINRGFTVKAIGTPTEGGYAATQVQVTKAPNIVVYNPTPNQQVRNTFQVSGIARVFENRLQIRLTNSRTNTRLFNQAVNANAPDAGLFGQFSQNIDLTANQNVLQTGDRLVLEVFQFSPRDGSEIDKATVNLTYSP